MAPGNGTYLEKALKNTDPRARRGLRAGAHFSKRGSRSMSSIASERVAAPAAFSAGLACRASGATLLALILPVALIILWQVSGRNGSIFGAAALRARRVWEAWLKWAFGANAMGLNPYSARGSKASSSPPSALPRASPSPFWWACRSASASAGRSWWPWCWTPPSSGCGRCRSRRGCPISIAIFGIADFGSVFLITIGAFYPIVITPPTGAGCGAQLDPRRADDGAPPLHGAAPRGAAGGAAFIFTGLRIGLGIAWTAVIVSENGRGEVRPRLRAVGTPIMWGGWTS